MKYLILFILIVSFLSCKNQNNQPVDERVSTSFEYIGNLMKSTDAPESCPLFTEKNIKKWYKINEVKFLTSPMGMGIPNSCNTAFFARNLSTTVSLQIYDFDSIESFNTAVEVMQMQNHEQVTGIGDIAFWTSNAMMGQKSLIAFKNGLRIVVTQPLKDAYTSDQHKARATQIMKEYLRRF